MTKDPIGVYEDAMARFERDELTPEERANPFSRLSVEKSINVEFEINGNTIKGTDVDTEQGISSEMPENAPPQVVEMYKEKIRSTLARLKVEEK